MARKKKIVGMTEDEVLASVNQWLNDSLDFQASELSQQRADGLNYYNGMPFGNERPGFSQVVTRDVQETIDWIMPSLLKVFTGGSQVVKYEGNTEEDVEQAEQETEYVNYLFTRKNEGFKVMHDWFQDALMMKTGVVKVYVEEDVTPKFDYFDGLDEDMVAEILSDPNTEALAETQNEDGTFALKVRTDHKKRNIKVVTVNPENFLIDRSATSIKDALLVAHREQQTVSWLRENGVPEDVIETLNFDTYDWTDGSPEKLARDFMDGTGDMAYHSDLNQEATRKAWVNECYVYIDEDGDGIAELRRIVIVGDHIISDDEVDSRPFADLTAYRIAHKFHGQSVYDKIGDLQKLRSNLTRSIMDNINVQNSGRFSVLEGQVNYEDLMSNQRQGIVRVKTQEAIKPLPVPQFSSDTFSMLDRFERDRSNRTGVSDQSRGLDGNTLHSNQAASSVSQVMTAAEQQIDMIARMFAETGVKQLFQLLHDFAIKYQDQEEVFQLRGKFVRVNPANWRARSDLIVTVGIGNMNKDQQLIHLERMFEKTQAIIAGGGMGILVSEKTIYNLLKEMTENAGYKDVSKYWIDPDSPEAQQAKAQRDEENAKPKPDDIKAQADAQRAQSDAMAKQAEAQAKQAEAQIKMAEVEIAKQNATIALREISLKEQQMQLDIEKFQWQRARDEAEFHLEMTQSRAAALGDGLTAVTKKPRKKPENS